MGKYIVDLIAVVLAAFIIFRCARKGFFLTILSFFKFLLAVLAAYFFGGKLGAVFGCLISCLVLMLFGSIVKLFFGTTEIYSASKVVRFFGDATLTDFFGWLNIDQWIAKLKS